MPLQPFCWRAAVTPCNPFQATIQPFSLVGWSYPINRIQYQNACMNLMRDKIMISRTAKTMMKLETGGKPGSQRQNLFCLSASAESGGLTLGPWWWAPTGTGTGWSTTKPVDPDRKSVV